MIRLFAPALLIALATPAFADDKPIAPKPAPTVAPATTTTTLNGAAPVKAEGANDNRAMGGGVNDNRGLNRSEGANDNRAMGGGVNDTRGNVSAIDGYMAPKAGTVSAEGAHDNRAMGGGVTDTTAGKAATAPAGVAGSAQTQATGAR